MDAEQSAQSGGGGSPAMGKAESLGRTGREKLNPPGVHTPQANYSHVARVGNTLYISGQVPVDPDGNVVGRGDAEAQAERCFRNLIAIVEHFGGTADNIMKMTTYITNWEFRAQVAKARDRLLSPPYPASTLVVISALASADFLVEIEAVAVLDD
jgi:enamine deaminase RidA (YjgF/YER057c/UK114 family)